MTRLILVTMLMIMACGAMAANVYLPPIRDVFTDGTIVPVYYNTSGARGLTGLRLKQEISAFARLSTSKQISDAQSIFRLMTTATSTKLIKRAATDASDYARVMEIKDKTGKIVYYVQANGAVTVGTPTPLSISSVYPANGATNVSNGVWFHATSAGLGWIRQNATLPCVTYNKSRVANVVLATQYIQGSSIAPTNTSAATAWCFPNLSGAGGATYTIRVVKGSLVQTDGESASSCGSAMTDVGGVCQSTFTMK